MIIVDEGIFDIPHDDYHQDPVIEPSLSAGIAKIFDQETPRHAWMAHPRLNPKYAFSHSDKFDLGEAAHTLLVRDMRAFAVIEADDFRTKDARAARDAAYNNGKIPMLKHRLAEVCAMVASCRAQLMHHQDAGLFTNGRGEQTIIWREPVEGYDAVWCRIRLDWLHGDNWEYIKSEKGAAKLLLSRFKPLGNIFPDYKTTECAHPDKWSRVCFNLGNDLRAAFYLRGIKRILNVAFPHYKFVVQETSAPYAVCVQELEPEALQVADAKVDAAIHFWAWCRKHDAWPGYPRLTCGIQLPPWKAHEWEQIQVRNRALADAMEDREANFKLGIAMQAPLEEQSK